MSSLPCTELPLVPKGILSAKQKVMKPRQGGKGEGGVLKWPPGRTQWWPRRPACILEDQLTAGPWGKGGKCAGDESSIYACFSSKHLISVSSVPGIEWVAKHPIQDSHIPQPNGQVKKINRREYRVYSFGYGARELTCRAPMLAWNSEVFWRIQDC